MLIWVPLGAVLAPTFLTLVVHEDHIAHLSGWDQVQVLGRIMKPDSHHVIPVPHHRHQGID